METLALSLPPPLRRTGTTAAAHRYLRFRCACLTVPLKEERTLLKEQQCTTNLQLESGREGSENYDNATDKTGLSWKERERRRKIGETRRRTNRERKEDEAAVRKEMERRRKISETKRGSVPWNLGKKHSQETKEKIGRGISKALRDPKAKRIWAERLKTKRAQQTLLNTWSHLIAINAKSGGLNENPLDWDQYDKIIQEFVSEELSLENERRAERERRKAREEILARMKVKKSAKGAECEKEEERRTKAKIRTKYGTQSFNLNLKKRLSRLHDVKKKLESASNVKEMERRRKSDEWDIEFIKERLEVGISFSSQLEMARNRKKQEKINSE